MFQDWKASGCLDGEVATLRCIPVIFNNIISAALIFVGIVALFFIIFAGFSFVTSGGDPKKVQGARQTMTFAIIGLIIVLLSFAIILLIGYLTNSTKCIDINSLLTGC
jgi:hypothetical protein